MEIDPAAEGLYYSKQSTGVTSQYVRVPPVRTVFIADVVATTVHEGICDDEGRLRPESAAFFGMMAGCGEFFTMDRKVGHIGQSVGRNDIRY